MSDCVSAWEKGWVGSGTKAPHMKRTLLEGVALVVGLVGVGEAPGESVGDEQEAGLIQRLTRRALCRSR